MICSVAKLQAFDFLLKDLLSQHNHPFFEKPYKLLVEINGQYWHGDFINFKKPEGNIVYDYIANGKNVQRTLTEGNTVLISKIKQALFARWDGGRLDSLKTPEAVFDFITSILEGIEFEEKDSPLPRRLLNAVSESGTSYPFLELDGENYSLVSLIEV